MVVATGYLSYEYFKTEAFGKIENSLSIGVFLSMTQLSIVVVPPGEEFCVALGVGLTLRLGDH